MTSPLDWDREGRDWPNRAFSRFVMASGLRWHVQVIGSGPVILLIHGTGASTHSWRDVLPRLSLTHTVVAPDLPGHAFTSIPSPGGLSLPVMSRSVGELMRALDLRPLLVVGHSAGAAIAIRGTIDGRIAPDAIVSINGALLPFHSAVGQLFSPMAKLLARAPLVPQLLSWRAESPARVKRLLDGMGSRIDSRGLELYARLLQTPAHVAGALGMMASWDLRTLTHDLPRLEALLLLVAGAEDTAIPPRQMFDVDARVSRATTTYLRGLGHLAHEEDPESVCDFILRAAARYEEQSTCPSARKGLA